MMALAQYVSTLGLIHPQGFTATGIIVMPVTVTATVTVKELRMDGRVMIRIRGYSGFVGYIMSNEFLLTIHKKY